MTPSSTLDRLDDLVRHARTVPLTDQVVLDPRAAAGLAHEIRAGAPSSAAMSVDALDRLIRGAKRVPLGDRIRIDREELYAATDAIRALPG